MADDAPQATPSGLQLIAQPTDNTYTAPETNPTSQLATALAQNGGKFSEFSQALGAQLQAADQAKAHAAAMQSSAPSYAEAVRTGQIPAAASPWFIQAFNQDRAQIAGSQQAQSVIADSETWAEKGYQDGGVAYQQRLTQELGKIREGLQQVPGMHPQDAEVGYQKGVGPLFQQALAQNNDEQLRSIQQQKVQDSTTLFEQGIETFMKANPGAAPEDVLNQLQPQIDQAKAIGFQDSDVKRMVFNSILGAAGQAKDVSILKLADAPFQGGSPLSLIAGEGGKPYGLETGQTAYYITREIEAEAMQAGKEDAARVKGEAQKFVGILLNTYGLAAIRQTPQQLQDLAAKNGISTEGVLMAADQLHTKFEGLVGMSTAAVQFNQTDPANVTRVLDYHTRAATEGLTVPLMAALKRDVALGNITTQQADTVITDGASTSRTKFSEQQADKRAAHADEAEARRQVQDAKTHVKDQIDYNTDAVVSAVEGAGLGYFKDPKTGEQRRREVQMRLRGAAGIVLLQNPDNVSGAQQAMQQEANRILIERLPKGPTTRAPAAGPGSSNLQAKAN